MSLFVRVNVNFYGHMKTIKLRARIGNDAFWIPPRIWSVAAEQRPDGSFDGVSAEEFALLIGYSGDATSMLQALLQAGFMDSDPLRIHDWEEHNNYHVTYADRARSAAKARWEKANAKKKIEKEKIVQGEDKETSIASSIAQASVQEPLLKLPAPPIEPTVEELAEEIYQLYPLKAAKPDALRAITKALKTNTSIYLRERTEAYAKAVKDTDTLIPHPATWFNGERFNDAPETWVRQQPNRNEHNSRNLNHNGSGRPTPAQQRNAEIVGANAVRDGIRKDRENSAPPPWAGGLQSGVQKGPLAA